MSVGLRRFPKGTSFRAVRSTIGAKRQKGYAAQEQSVFSVFLIVCENTPPMYLIGEYAGAYRLRQRPRIPTETQNARGSTSSPTVSLSA